jgi:hypothetical protein
VPNRGHAECDQILRRQFAQDFGVNVVVEERALVLFEPEPSEPSRDVHRGTHAGRAPS